MERKFRRLLYDLGYGDYTKEKQEQPNISLEKIDFLLKNVENHRRGRGQSQNTAQLLPLLCRAGKRQHILLGKYIIFLHTFICLAKRSVF